MKKRWRWIIPAVLGAAGIAAFIVGLVWGYLTTPGFVQPQLGEGDIQIYVNPRSTVTISWPEAEEEGVSYLLYYRSGRDGSYRLIGEYGENSATVTGISLEQPFDLRLRTAAPAQNFFGMTRKMVSHESRDVTVQPQKVDTPELLSISSGDNKMTVSWTSGDATRYEICVSDRNGGYQPVATSIGASYQLEFGYHGNLNMPSYDEPVPLAVRAVYQGEGYVLCGPCSREFEAKREELLGEALTLDYRMNADRMYTLFWDEAKGDSYELQEWSGKEGAWVTLAKMDAADDLFYDTERLRSGSYHQYRLVSRAGSSKQANAQTVATAEVSFYASISPIYSTVWPIEDLMLYDDTSRSRTVDTVPAGTALCVLSENGNWFYVRYLNSYGYIDSRFCMINLPEYVGDYCTYDITNSYQSVFAVHGHPIAKITQQMLPGYENVRTAEEDFLAPYLYPSAKKLLTAAQNAMEDGYRLKIYEAYRPHETTRFIYDTTAAVLNTVALDWNNQGYAVDPRTGYRADLATGKLIDPQTGRLVDPSTVPDAQPPEEEDEDQTAAQTAFFVTRPLLVTPLSAVTEPDGPTPGVQMVPEGEPEAAPSETPEPEPSQTPVPIESEAPSQEPQPQPPASQEPVPTPEPSPVPSASPSESPAPGEGGSPEPEPVINLDPDGEPEDSEEDPEDAETPVAEVAGSYRQIMTNGQYSLSSFLARVTSAHNRGIALDLTLELVSNGQELTMQSKMHDLSWHSVTSENNDNAERLAGYMTGVGLKGLSSEWWHFQDDDTRAEIGLDTYLSKGVNLSGWVKDDKGWRFRGADGTFYRSTSITVDGVAYRITSEGYIVE